MRQYIDFLGAHAPFDALDAADLEALARRIEVEYVAAGTGVITANGPVLDHLYLIRKGAVDVVDRGRVIDQLGEGDVFGHLSVLSGLPPPLAVRTSEDTLLYRLPDPRPLVADPRRLRFQNYGLEHARTRGVLDPVQRTVGKHLRPPVWVQADDPLAAVAERITDTGQSYALVHTPDGVGIVTDAAFRRACGVVPADARIVEIAAAPVHTVRVEETLDQAYVRMVDLGVHHLVAVDAAGRVIGVVRAIDLASADVRDPLLARSAIESASSMAQLEEAAKLLPSTALELVGSGLPPERVALLLTAVRDALLRKLIELVGSPDDPQCSWSVLGSTARFEPLLDSDVDTALAWPDAVADLAAGHRERAGRVLAGLERCGLRRCPVGINADNPEYSRSAAEWAALADRWQRSPRGDLPALIATVTDSRAITDLVFGRAVNERLRGGRVSREFLTAMLASTLRVKPPAGFVRDFVVEHSGEHRGRLDLRGRGLLPIAAIGRWVAVVTGDAHGSTPDRLRRGAEAGVLTADEVDSLLGAFALIYELVLRHQADVLRSGSGVPGHHLDPRALEPLTRRYLRSVFREVTLVQARLESHGIRRAR